MREDVNKKGSPPLNATLFRCTFFGFYFPSAINLCLVFKKVKKKELGKRLKRVVFKVGDGKKISIQFFPYCHAKFIFLKKEFSKCLYQIFIYLKNIILRNFWYQVIQVISNLSHSKTSIYKKQSVTAYFKNTDRRINILFMLWITKQYHAELNLCKRQ